MLTKEQLCAQLQESKRRFDSYANVPTKKRWSPTDRFEVRIQGVLYDMDMAGIQMFLETEPEICLTKIDNYDHPKNPSVRFYFGNKEAMAWIDSGETMLTAEKIMARYPWMKIES